MNQFSPQQNHPKCRTGKGLYFITTYEKPKVSGRRARQYAVYTVCLRYRTAFLYRTGIPQDQSWSTWWFRQESLGSLWNPPFGPSECVFSCPNPRECVNKWYVSFLISCTMAMCKTSFGSWNCNRTPAGYYRAEGLIKNVNTIEDYRNIDKAQVIQEAGGKVSKAKLDNTDYGKGTK